MRIVRLAYHEYRGTPREWTLRPVSFDQINLIAGRNASGKSRLLNVINSLASLLTGAQRQLYMSGYYEVEFERQRGTARYELELKERLVQQEKYTVDGVLMLDRSSGGGARIKAVELGDEMRFESPQINSPLSCGAILSSILF